MKSIGLLKNAILFLLPCLLTVPFNKTLSLLWLVAYAKIGLIDPMLGIFIQLFTNLLSLMLFVFVFRQFHTKLPIRDQDILILLIFSGYSILTLCLSNYILLDLLSACAPKHWGEIHLLNFGFSHTLNFLAPFIATCIFLKQLLSKTLNTAT